MGRLNYGSVNIPKSLKPRIRAAAQLIGWSEAQVAEAAIEYALDAAASSSAPGSACKLIRLLASESWGNATYSGCAAFAADQPNSAPGVVLPDRSHASKEGLRHMIRKAQAAT